MSYSIVGNCPHCGAPIYAEDPDDSCTMKPFGPPRSIRSCNCVPARGAREWTDRVWSAPQSPPWDHTIDLQLADADVTAGRVVSFETMKDPIADLHN